MSVLFSDKYSNALIGCVNFPARERKGVIAICPAMTSIANGSSSIITHFSVIELEF
jgi:hypothetical protein